jgi:CheY-like chemotaxis protein
MLRDEPRKAAAPAREAPATPRDATPAPRGSVLIVDDDEDLAASLKDMIEDLGYHATCAGNGREALARIEEHAPSLILVDLFMPVMGGIELLHVLKADRRLSVIPKVIMTAANDQMVGVKEDVSVLYKPIDFDALIHLLEQHSQTLAPK